MTNDEIIRQAALDNGILTEMQLVELMDNGEDVPLHTLHGWAERGRKKGINYKVRKGEHGIGVMLWKKKKSKNNNVIEFYKAEAYLFSDKQMDISQTYENA